MTGDEGHGPLVPRWLDRAGAVSWRVIVSVVAVAVVGAVLYYLRIVSLAILFGFLFASVLHPLAATVRRRGGSRLVAGLSGVLVMLSIFVVLLVVLIPVLSSTLPQLLEQLNSAMAEVRTWLETGPLGLTPEDVAKLRESLKGASGAIASVVGQGLLAGFSVLTSVITVLALALITTYFFLKDGDEQWAVTVRWAPVNQPRIFDQAGRNAFDALGKYVLGVAKVGVVDASLIGVGLLLLGFGAMALPLAFFVFFGAFVPYIGAFLAGTIAVMVGLSEGGVPLMLATLALVVFVQFLEGNFISPKLLGEAVSMHPLVVLMLMTVGGLVAGILGMMLVIPIASVILGMTKTYAYASGSPRLNPSDG